MSIHCRSPVEPPRAHAAVGAERGGWEGLQLPACLVCAARSWMQHPPTPLLPHPPASRQTPCGETSHMPFPPPRLGNTSSWPTSLGTWFTAVVGSCGAVKISSGTDAFSLHCSQVPSLVDGCVLLCTNA
ncbi:hypothetical protein BST61_g6923 [Cercospora zeina]